MALKDDVQTINDESSAMMALLVFQAKSSFRVEGVNLDIPASLIPQILTDKLKADFNASLTRCRQAAARLPVSV